MSSSCDDFEEAPVKKSTKKKQVGQSETKSNKKAKNKENVSPSGVSDPAVTTKPSPAEVQAVVPVAAPSTVPVPDHSAASALQLPPLTDPGEQKIFDYLRQNNRPYSHVQVFENLHKSVKKAFVPRLLDSLAEKQYLTCKEFGKTKLYNINQAIFPPVNPAELTMLDAQIVTLTAELQSATNTLAAARKDVGSLSSSMTNEALAEALQNTEQQVAEKRAKLAKLTDGSTALLTKAQVATHQSNFNNYFTAWKKRKQAVKTMIDTYMEAAPKSVTRKKFMEEKGIETDEEAGVDISQYEPFFVKLR